MTDSQRPTFEGGRNIAMKVPPHQWEATVGFYRDVLGLEVIERAPTTPPSVCFAFGANRLWIDRVDTASHAELWLEIKTDDVQAATGHLKRHGVVRRDEIETLPDDFAGYWIQDPAGVVHIVSETKR